MAAVDPLKIWLDAEERNKQIESERFRKLQQELLAVLPEEFWIQVFVLLTPSNILLCRLVCKKWARIAFDKYLWRKIYSMYFKDANSLLKTPENWCNFYFQKLHRDVVQAEEANQRKNRIFLMQEKKKGCEAAQLEFWLKNPDEPRICKYCDQEYLEIFNKVALQCSKHSGVFNEGLSRWSCCSKPGIIAQGCQECRHEVNVTKGILYNKLLLAK